MSEAAVRFERWRRAIPLLTFVLLAGLSILVASDITRIVGVAVAVVALFTVGGLFQAPIKTFAVLIATYGVLQSQLQVLQLVPVGLFTINAAQLFILGLSALLLLRVLADLAVGRAVPRPPLAVVYLVLLAAWIVQALIRADDTRYAAPIYGRFVAGVVVFGFTYFFTRSLVDLRRLWLGSAVAALAAGVLAILEIAQGRGALESISVGAHRASGTLGGAVATGTFCFFGLGVALAMSQARESKRELLPMLVVASSALGILATFARTAIVGAVVLAIAWLVLARAYSTGSSTRAQFALIVGALAAAVFLATRVLTTETVEARLEDIPGLSQQQMVNPNVGSGRGLIWKSVLDRQVESQPHEWIFGHGLGSVPNDLKMTMGILVDAHNSYLNLLYDTGVIGLALYLLFAGALLRALYRGRYSRHPQVRTISILWCCYMVAFFLSTVMFNGYVYAVGATWYSLAVSGGILGLLVADQRSSIDDSTP